MIDGLSFPEPARRISLNDRDHHMVRANLTADWRTAAGWAATAAGRTPSERAHPPCLIEVSFPVTRVTQRRDPSNWMPTVKAIVDGLVDAGFFPDDDSAHVKILEPTVHYATSSPRVHIRFIPMEVQA